MKGNHTSRLSSRSIRLGKHSSLVEKGHAVGKVVIEVEAK